MSLLGWLVLLWAIFSTIFFFIGLFCGETAFFVPSKSGGGNPASVTFETSPVWFLVFMGANALVSLVCWALFFDWLKGRNREVKL